MSALFLRQLSEKTHRGLEGRVRSGKSAGGLSFGYRLDRNPLPDGTYSTGDRSIDPTDAAVVHRIFRDYANGKSARTIAIELNREGVAPPRASSCAASAAWSFSTISGNWKRGTGILNNELYIGRLVWNRQRFVKDPATGKRQARLNPPEDWINEEVPELRIIDDALWHKVKVKQGAIREEILGARSVNDRAPGTEGARRSRYLLSGLLSCGCCGAGYSMISDSRYGCSAARNKGTCSNRKTIARKEIEERVLNGLREKLMAPALVAEFIAEFQREVQRERHAANAARSGLEKRLAQLRKEISNIIGAITQGMFHPSMKEQMDRLEEERAAVEAKLAATAMPEPVVLHPGLADIYRRKVEDLAEALNGAEDKAEAAELLRGLIEKVVIHPREDGHIIELFGELGAILQLCQGDSGYDKARSGATGVCVGVRQLTMVAGTHFQKYLPLHQECGGQRHKGAAPPSALHIAAPAPACHKAHTAQLSPAPRLYTKDLTSLIFRTAYGSKKRMLWPLLIGKHPNPATSGRKSPSAFIRHPAARSPPRASSGRPAVLPRPDRQWCAASSPLAAASRRPLSPTGCRSA